MEPSLFDLLPPDAPVAPEIKAAKGRGEAKGARDAVHDEIKVPAGAGGLKVRVLLPGALSEALWYAAGPLPEEDIPLGSLARVPFHSREATGLVVEKAMTALPFETRPLRRVMPSLVSEKWMGFLDWMAKYYGTPSSVVFSGCIPSFALKALVSPPKPRKKKEEGKPRKKKAKAAEAASDPGAATGMGPETPAVMKAEAPAGTPLRLTSEQEEAVKAVTEYLEKGIYRSFLLHGVTGSGKTLVYLHLTRRALAAGKNVLVLLPEIALTPQTLDRFRAFLGIEVLALHSGLPAPEKRALWQALFDKRARVVVGARSAVLSPLDNLGLVVVDEEHDSSYKQSEAAPRYNARDLALYRGQAWNCPVVLGSATPSLESYSAALSGKHGLLVLKRRATGSKKPEVRIVDMREQYELQGDQALSIPLREALQECLKEGEQAILLLNRRGYAQRRLCKACGKPQECPKCLIPVVWHKAERAAKCHYCDFRLPSLFHCDSCHENSCIEVGRGIEKVEETLLDLFPQAGLLRLDRDTTQRIGSTEDILRRFKAGEAAFLLGTQMVAKGHDFPKVNLVGVIDADTGLGFSDFRAQERTFQLITQVAGRAGRHADSGKVYLQTFRPGNPVLGFALGHDYESFYRHEIELRRELSYPPFRRLLLIEMSSEDEDLVQREMDRLAAPFRALAARIGAPVLGPAFAALKRLHGRTRSQILAKCGAPNQMAWLLEEVHKAYTPPARKLALRIDVDPLSML